MDECGENFGGVIHRCCLWGVTMCWVEHCLARDSVPACGGNMEEPGAVMSICGAEVPSVHRSGARAGSCFWLIYNCGMCASWGKGDAIKVMGALEHMLGREFWVDAQGA